MKGTLRNGGQETATDSAGLIDMVDDTALPHVRHAVCKTSCRFVPMRGAFHQAGQTRLTRSGGRGGEDFSRGGACPVGLQKSHAGRHSRR